MEAYTFQLLLHTFFAEFCRTFAYIFPEFFMEIIYIAVANPFCNYIYFVIVLQKKRFGMLNSNVVHIRIEAFPHRFIKDFAEISAVVPKKRCNRLQLNIALVVVVDIVKDIV